MSKEIVPIERIAESIRWIRGHKVLLDSDLALLYDVATKVLNQAVKRNRERFPDDFMFQLNADETGFLRLQFVTSEKGKRTNWSQIVTSSKKHRGKRYRPYAFTGQGIAMLSSVLNSDRAITVNIAIMRAFVKLRQTLESSRELAQKFSELEQRVGKHDEDITAIPEAIRQLMAPSEKPRREIGFHVREKAAGYRTRKRA
jgi:ORF6N domain